MAEDSAPRLRNPPSPVQLLLQVTELRIAILSHIPNLQTLKNLVLSSSTFSTVYYSHQRQILLHLALRVFDVDRINMVIPLLACRAQHVQTLASNHLERVTELLETNLEHNALTKQAGVQISIEECKQMLLLKDIASQICDDLFSQMPLNHPLGGRSMMSQMPLSATERGRITTAICRWQLWAGLFFQKTRNIQNDYPVARIDLDTQRVVYLGRYTQWEQEQLSCLYSYVQQRCWQIQSECCKWFLEDKGLDPAEEGLDDYGSLVPEAQSIPTKIKTTKVDTSSLKKVLLFPSRAK